MKMRKICGELSARSVVDSIAPGQGRFANALQVDDFAAENDELILSLH
jgi:hypothetical protein